MVDCFKLKKRYSFHLVILSVFLSSLFQFECSETNTSDLIMESDEIDSINDIHNISLPSAKGDKDVFRGSGKGTSQEKNDLERQFDISQSEDRDDGWFIMIENENETNFTPPYGTTIVLLKHGQEYDSIFFDPADLGEYDGWIGKSYWWDVDKDGKEEVMENIMEISMGTVHGAAIDTSNNLWMWGSNINGRLGDGTKQERHIPVKILDDIKSVSLGNGHSAAIDIEGNLWMWGYNEYGQLGNGTNEDSYTAVNILSFINNKFLEE